MGSRGSAPELVSIWCREPDPQTEPAACRHHTLSPQFHWEHAGENLCWKRPPADLPLRRGGARCR
jgi:hypothetical protein